MRAVRRGAGLAAPVTPAIDITSWAERYAQPPRPSSACGCSRPPSSSSPTRTPVPLRQYAALLDLSFGLGFQTDALAKLRERYGFEYVDHAKDARPRSADRGGGATPLFSRDDREPRRAAARPRHRGAGLARRRSSPRTAGSPRSIIPTSSHGEPAEAQNAAAARFIEITRAYEDTSWRSTANREVATFADSDVYDVRWEYRLVHWLFTAGLPAVPLRRP